MNLKRWRYAIIGIILLFLAGLVYAWSVLSQPIAIEFSHCSQAQISLTFTLTMAFFCIGCLASGIVAKKVNVKILIWIGAVLFFAGFMLASVAQNLGLLYLGFGVLAGFSSGFVYNVVLSTMSKWFADKQGFISGLLLMGFGFSSFLIGKMYQAFTPAEIGGWRISFKVMAIILLVVIFAGGLLFKAPSADYVLPAPAKQKKVSKARQGGIDVPSSVMVRKSAFWFYFVWVVLLSASGLMLVSQASGFVAEATPAIYANAPGAVATVVGLISVFNGVGRIFMGGLFDKVGARITMLIVNSGFVLFVLIQFLAFQTGSFAVVVVAFIIGGLAYSGITPTNSAFINSFFGPTHFPMNFSIINLNLLIGSFGSTIAGALYDATQTYKTILIVMLIAMAAAYVCTMIIRKPME
ncbi:MAG: MFS transporter [Eubacterium sp.]|nr:MFS transporter [Eubacterium sp.]